MVKFLERYFFNYIKEVITKEIYDLRQDNAKCIMNTLIIIIRKIDIINICELYDLDF